MSQRPTDLKRQLLLSAIECSGGETANTFTFEELLVKAWESNHTAWGLRGFEDKHPDSERIHRELDSRGKASKGIVDLGLLERVQPRVYRLTPKGLASASRVGPEHKGVREKAARKMEDEVRRIIEHTTFKQWLADSRKPDRFRDAGAFWGVAPGTPSPVIRKRIQRIEDTLTAALSLLEEKNVSELGSGRGHLLFDKTDIQRSLAFHQSLKARFSNDLKVLGVRFDA